MQTTNADDFVLNELARLRADLEANQEQLRATQRRLKATWAVCSAILLGGLGLAASPTAQAQFGITLTSLNTRLTAVENKTTPLSYNSTTKRLTVTGANVMIIDGTGATESTSGLGNLQVGYNALRGDGDLRTGSHNLIVGDENNYASYGGLVAGRFNEITGIYASVSGGIQNTASGGYASVSGGALNTASGIYASVSGGAQNTASGGYASVSGGVQNTASGPIVSISGGYLNTASGPRASISGGVGNTASGPLSSILGGNTILLDTSNGTYPAGP
jgi:hypothetical protein